MHMIYFLISILYCVNSYLTNNQWSLIKKILVHKNTPSEIKDKTKKIVFNEYYYWSRKQTYNFIKNNTKITYNINSQELMHYSYIGLNNAINKYNYSSNNKFSKYTEKYIYYELLRGVTELSPLKLLPHKYRINRIWKQNNRALYKSSMSKIQFVGDDEWIFKNKKDIEDLEDERLIKINKINKLVNTLDDPILINIFKYRYNYDLSIKNKLNKVSQLVNLSTESIRLKLKLVTKYLKDNVEDL